MAQQNGPTLVGVLVEGDARPWRAAGFSCSDRGFQAGEVTVAFGGPAGAPTLVFDPSCGPLDGVVSTDAIGDVDPSSLPCEHANGTCGVDHVVVTSPDVERTSAVLADAGLELLGSREAQLDGAAVQQRFHRVGPCLVELAGPSEPGEGSAQFWGITFVTSSIDELPALDPPPVASIRDAVQPGRRIATAVLSIGLPTRVAFMDPRTKNQ